MNAQLLDLYHAHVAAAFDRQMRLSDLLDAHAKDEPWSYVVSTATLTFGETLRFEALDLGSHAHPDNSWLWAWCNPHLQLTAANRDLGKAVQEIGSRQNIDAFQATRQFNCEQQLGIELSDFADHVLAVVIAGALGFDAYYSMPFEHGRSVALICDPRLRVKEARPAHRITSLFSQLVMALPVFDQRRAFLAYCQSYGIQPATKGDQLLVSRDNVEILRAPCDPANRRKWRQHVAFCVKMSRATRRPRKG